MRRLEFFFTLIDVLSTVDSLGLLLYWCTNRKEIITVGWRFSVSDTSGDVSSPTPVTMKLLGSNNVGHKFEQLLTPVLQSDLSLDFHTDVSTINHFQYKNKAMKYLGQSCKQFIHRICRLAGDKTMEGATAESDSSDSVH